MSERDSANYLLGKLYNLAKVSEVLPGNHADTKVFLDSILLIQELESQLKQKDEQIKILRLFLEEAISRLR